MWLRCADGPPAQVERFWLQCDAALCVLAGLGLDALRAALERRLARRWLWAACGWTFSVGLLVHMANSNYR